uniref:Uncharacterized protein n=1 Tax=candidate division WOR-3 bacterium TaxID=2052148 RepID=A0A7C6EIR8_UNCW3
MNYKHKGLAQGRWFQLTLIEQLANIGSEVERAIRWRPKNQKYFEGAIERALELIDLTVSDVKNRKRLKELLRLREALVDYFYFDNQYGSSDKLWHNYFYPFFYVARKGKV